MVEVHHHVYSSVPHLGSLRSLSKNNLDEKILIHWMKYFFPWPGLWNENQAHAETSYFSDDFGLRSPVIQKPFLPKKGIP